MLNNLTMPYEYFYGKPVELGLDNITASLICMDLSDIKTDIDTLVDNGVHYLHADFMDNTFVPRLGISPELIKWIKARYGYNVEIDSHLMVQNPYDCIDVIAPYSDWVFFHYEAVPDPVRILQKIEKASPAKKGIVYNIGTNINYDLEETELLDGVMFMGISPGVLGTKSWPDVIRNKIYDFRHTFKYGTIENSKRSVFVDGGVNFGSIKKLLVNSKVSLMRNEQEILANKVVCGSSTLFKIDDETALMDRDEMIKFNIERIKEALK